MMNRNARLARITSPLLVCALLTGCYSTTQVKVTELPNLNDQRVMEGSGVAYGGGGSNVVVTSMSTTTTLEKPDGTMLAVKGTPEVILSVQGRRQSYAYPFRATIEGDTLSIAGSNAANRVPLRLVDSAHVRQYDRGKSALAWGAAGVGVVLITLIALSASTPSDY